MEGRYGLGERRCGHRSVWDRHRDFIPLVGVTQVSTALQGLCGGGNPFLREPTTRLVLEVATRRVERRQIEGVVALQHGADVVIFDVTMQQTERGKDAGIAWNNHRRHIEQFCQASGMQWSGATTRQEHKIAWVIAALNRNGPHRTSHGVI